MLPQSLGSPCAAGTLLPRAVIQRQTPPLHCVLRDSARCCACSICQRVTWVTSLLSVRNGSNSLHGGEQQEQWAKGSVMPDTAALSYPKNTYNAVSYRHLHAGGSMLAHAPSPGRRRSR